MLESGFDSHAKFDLRVKRYVQNYGYNPGLGCRQCGNKSDNPVNRDQSQMLSMVYGPPSETQKLPVT